MLGPLAHWYSAIFALSWGGPAHSKPHLFTKPLAISPYAVWRGNCIIYCMCRHPLTAICILLLSLASSMTLIAEVPIELPLSKGKGGGLELSLTIDGQQAIFLLDTGAAMATINGDLFNRIKMRGHVRKTREVAARMADGRTRRLGVYEVGTLHLTGNCDLGLLEVIVVPGSGRNLLGLNVLAEFAPLTLSLNPPALGLSGCGANTTTAAVPSTTKAVAYLP